MNLASIAANIQKNPEEISWSWLLKRILCAFAIAIMLCIPLPTPFKYLLGVFFFLIGAETAYRLFWSGTIIVIGLAGQLFSIAINVVSGICWFVILRYLFGEAFHLYPIVAYDVLWNSKEGFFGSTFWGRQASPFIAREIYFLAIDGLIAGAIMKGKWFGWPIAILAFICIGFGLFFPEWAGGLEEDRKRLGESFREKGIIQTLLPPSPAPATTAALTPALTQAQFLTPSQFAAQPLFDGVCPGAERRTLDYEQIFQKSPPPPEEPYQVAIRGNDAYPSDCFGPVIRLPSTMASGWCAKPFMDEDNDHTWSISFQKASAADGSPRGTYGPFHWTNKPEDNGYLPDMMVFRIKGIHQADGGVTFYPAPRGTCEKPNWPNPN